MIIDGRVAAFATSAGLQVHVRADRVEISSFDITMLVDIDADEGFSVTEVERGSVQGIALLTRSEALLDRFIALRAGHVWRSRHHAPRIAPPHLDELPHDTAVEPLADGWSRVTSPLGVARVASQFEARELARLAALTVDDVIEAFTSSRGSSAAH